MNLSTDAMKAAEIAARLVARKFEGYVDREDLEADGYEWLLLHESRIEHATFPDGKLHVAQLASEIASVLARRSRREKMRILGMDPSDQSKYTRVAVEAALPAVWDPGYRPPRAEGRGRSDPATRGAWETVVIDMKRAVREVCTKTDEAALFATYVLEAKGREASYRTGIPRSEIPERVEKVVRQMLDFLNGEYTVELDEIDSLLEEGPGTRHAITNAHARVIQSSQYGGE